ncbi:unnamed protein product [Blepharisma stoltei]|uniref:PPM-type phosphatase domain-containing protein n=1 Tax=Blepharisma stoltei TaxID=1481888 RepID=A0AAU9ILH3_9CILI|nr:unnamed protein product [Blepharisma stoltei]
MAVSALKVTPTWRKFNLDLDIPDIDTEYRRKKMKFSYDQWEDTIVQSNRYGVCMKKGLRPYMEDAYRAIENFHGKSDAFGVFDGHSGNSASKFASQKLLDSLEKTDEESIKKAFEATDKAYCSLNTSQEGGSTAAIAIIEDNLLKVANVGDSKILLISEEETEILSRDHLASDLSEQTRIEQAGGYVFPVGKVFRVHGQLAISRSLGDAKLKEFVISEPYVAERQINKNDLALVIATDGLFDVLNKEEIAKIVRSAENLKPFQVAEMLVQEAMIKGSRDNITCIVVSIRGYGSFNNCI